MEFSPPTSLSVSSVIRGQHVYKAIWTPYLSEEMVLAAEEGDVVSFGILRRNVCEKLCINSWNALAIDNSMGRIHGDNELDRILEITDLDEFELVESPLEQLDS